MHFSLANCFTTLDSTPEDSAIVRRIGDWLTVRCAGYEYAPAYKSGLWDGNSRFLSSRNFFPTGLLPLVTNRLTDIGAPYTVTDTRHLPTPPVNRDRRAHVELRDYQHAAVTAFFSTKIFDLPFHRGIIKIATGGGKTAVAAEILSNLFPQRALFLVHRVDLLWQTKTALEQLLGEKVGAIGNGSADLDTRVTVATVQTLSNDLNAFRDFLYAVDIFVSDEAHHMAAKTFQSVANACIRAGTRLALSATPFKKDDLVQAYRLEGATGPIVYEQTPGALISAGHLPTVMVQYHQVTDPPNIRAVPYSEAITQGIVNNTVRNGYIVHTVHDAMAKGRRILVVVQRLAHGEILAKHLGCLFLSGKEPVETRLTAAEDLRTGLRKVLVVTNIWQEGVDIPDIDMVVLAGGGKSQLDTLQRIGRGMRPKPKGEHLLVIDFVDLTHRTLMKHSKARLQTCADAGFHIAPAAA